MYGQCATGIGKIDIHEQARGSLTTQASLDLKMGKYYLKKANILSLYIHPRASTWCSALRVLNSLAKPNCLRLGMADRLR